MLMILLGKYWIIDTNYGLYKGKYYPEFSSCQNANNHFKGKAKYMFLIVQNNSLFW